VINGNELLKKTDPFIMQKLMKKTMSIKKPIETKLAF